MLVYEVYKYTSGTLEFQPITYKEILSAAIRFIRFMVALNARSFEHIQQLHALALSRGGTDEGTPGHRPQYGQGFHSAYVRDPDRNKLAFVYYDSEG